MADSPNGKPTPQERYSETANNPPVDPRKPPANTEPGSHSTGGRKDHAQPGEGEPPR